MGSLSKAFTSSIGKKFVVGLTGFFLISFIIIHVSLNSLIFANDNGETFEVAAHFMSHNPIVRILEIGLFVGLIAHIVQALMVTRENMAARPQRYAVNNPSANSTWYSRSMSLLGTLILLFLVMHLIHFWWPTKVALFGSDEAFRSYDIMLIQFKNPLVVLAYLVGVISLGFHLLHGFSSAFQTMGWRHKKWTPVVKTIGTAFSIIVTVLFAAMPLAIFFEVIK